MQTCVFFPEDLFFLGSTEAICGLSSWRKWDFSNKDGVEFSLLLQALCGMEWNGHMITGVEKSRILWGNRNCKSEYELVATSTTLLYGVEKESTEYGVPTYRRRKTFLQDMKMPQMELKPSLFNFLIVDRLQ